jgi:chromosome partitioning protein
VTDREELRARAASIFEQLRTEERPRLPEPDGTDGAGSNDTTDGTDTNGATRTTDDHGATRTTEDNGTTDATGRAEGIPPGAGPAERRPAQPDDAGTATATATATATDDLVTDGRSPERRIADALNGVSAPGPGTATAEPPIPGSETSARARHPGTKHALPRVLAIANQKGGVGKTTTAVNLGASLADLDYRVLVVDLDPQGNATTGLGINARSLESSIYDVILHDVPAEDVIEPTSLRNLFVMPATIDLAGAEIELVPVFSRELRLRRALEAIREDYDFILIDCPPSLGLLTINGLAAAGEVAVPIQCEYYALEGLSQLLRNVGMVQANLNGPLELSTIILTMYDARTRLAEQVVSEVRQHFGDRVCRNVVPRTVRLSEAPSFGQPIIVFDASSRGSIAYRELAKEVSGGASQRPG